MSVHEPAKRFEFFRDLLVRHAYRMLGSYADAEDIVQEAFLRFDASIARTAIRDDRAFLRATVTRLCLDSLRSARARRENYVGPWLPEFVVADAPDPLEDLALADDVSFALLMVLERCSPAERAAFLLHDALGVSFREIADTLGRTESAVRKLASRARERVHEKGRHGGVPTEEAMRVRDAFLEALRTDDVGAMERLLTDDVVFTSDGGGVVTSAIVPIFGRDRVTRLVFGLAHKNAASLRRVELATLNGLPGIVAIGEEGILSALAFVVVGGAIRSLYAMRNPQKLRTLTEFFHLS